MSTPKTTRICVLTPSGRGAVAVVAVEGDTAVAATDSFFQAANDRPLSEQPLGRIVYGHWGDSHGEDLVIVRRDVSSLEIHCHGGRQSSAQIIADLEVGGGTVIDSYQWLIGRRIPPLTIDAHLALLQATTLRSATILLAQYHGALQRELEVLIAELTDKNVAAAKLRIEHLLQYASLGRHLTHPWQVVIAGRPNVGKSSLINALVGYERAIVFDQPGTTRDVISSTTAIEGWPVEFSDTAGLHNASSANKIGTIESAGISLARERLATADLAVWVLDAAEISEDTNQSVWQLAKQQAEAVGLQLDAQKTRLVRNKIDLVTASHITASDATGSQATASKASQIADTSAATGEGIRELLSLISAQLVPATPPPNTALPFTAKQVDTLHAALVALNQNRLKIATTQIRCLISVDNQR